MRTSQFWKNHFENNLKKERVDWSLKPDITKIEKDSILFSLKAWQLGETSDGSNLIKAASKYANKISDQDYIDAVKLFIKEEQKHGNNLGIYIDKIGEKRKKKDIGDSIFRIVRGFNTSMELWTITVLIVECAAQIFYKALMDSTHCLLLKQICHDILIDEAHHIKFQNERLSMIFNSKGFYNKAFSIGLYGILFFFTIHAIWIGHSKAFKSGNVNKNEFMRQMYFKFFNSLKFVHAKPMSQSTGNYSLV